MTHLPAQPAAVRTESAAEIDRAGMIAYRRFANQGSLLGGSALPQNVVVTSTEAHVATLRINRPDHENRLNLAVLKALCAALQQAEADTGIRAIVLTGTGETFCCGGDLEDFAVGDTKAYREFGKCFGGLHLAVSNLTKPVLAAVNGHARAGGMSLLSICDLAVARASAQFGMPEIRAGLWPVMAMVSLNRALPRKRAFELYYFGESFDAEQARRWGLVNWVVPDDEFEAAVRRRAKRLAALPVTAVSIGRTTFVGIGERSYPDGFAYSGDRLVDLLTEPEAAEALARRLKRERQ